MRRAFTALVAKDLRLFFADRRAVIFSVLAPIAIASFFGFIFNEGDRQDATRVAVLVVDQDGSPISRDLTARLSADAALTVRATTLEEATRTIRRGRAAAAVVLPEGFGETSAGAFFGGGTATKARLPVLYDPSRSTEAAMLEGILAGHGMQAVSKEMFTGPTGRAAADDAIGRVERSADMPAAERAALLDLLRGVQRWNATPSAQGGVSGGGGLTIPFEVEKQPVTSRTGVRYNGYAHAFAGMGVQFILFMAIEMGVGMLEQRRDGLWKRLRAAPLSRAVLLGARAVSTALLSLFILFFLFLFAGIVFGVGIEGSVIGFVGVAVSFSLMTAAFGLLIASLGRTPDATRGLSIVVTLLLVMLGGAWVPTFVFPAWMQQLTMAVPTRWAVDGLDATTWRGLGLSSVALPIALLTGTAALCGALAAARFRWEE